MEILQFNPNMVNNSPAQHPNTTNGSEDNLPISAETETIVKQVSAAFEQKFNIIALVIHAHTEQLNNLDLGTKIEHILNEINSLTSSVTKLTDRVATVEKKTDVLLKMQDHRYFMETLLQNSKKDINIALNSLYADDCSELKTILQFASYDTKWAYELKSVLCFNKKYFYTDNNPLAASLRKSCQVNDDNCLNLSAADHAKKSVKELDYAKKTIIETMVKCITEAISAEMYNSESKKILVRLCNETTANIVKMFPKTTTFNLFPEDLLKSKAVNELSDEEEIDNKPNATINAIAEKIDTIASDVNELKESHNELRASLQEETLNK